MKIICTKKEQEALMFALVRSTECPVVLKEKEDCPVHLGKITTCEECMLQNIDWQVCEKSRFLEDNIDKEAR